MSSYTKSGSFWYRPDSPGDNDSTYTGANRYWYRGPDSKTLADGFEYVGTSAKLHRLTAEALSSVDPSAQINRLSGEVLSTSDVSAYLNRLVLEVLSSNITDRRRPKFFTFLID